MAKKYKINEEKCIGCGICVAVCEGGAEMEEDGKAKIIDSDKMDKCGGASVCPYEAIEEVK
ncbi:MAG: 4Fe-4S binding protein [bacterium]|nr:4Fe-4S binding protein [bacterium]